MLIFFLLAGTTMLAAGTAVSATEPLCQAKRVCIYDGNDFAGLLGTRRAGGRLKNVSSTANDKTDSWKNQTDTATKKGKNAAWYHDRGGKGRCVNMGQGKSDKNLNFYDSDELSSWRTNRGC